MKKLLIILLLSITLTSCGLTTEEVVKEVKTCKDGGLVPNVDNTFGTTVTCSYSSDSSKKTITPNDQKTIDMCISQGKSWRRSSWDSFIECYKN